MLLLLSRDGALPCVRRGVRISAMFPFMEFSASWSSSIRELTAVLLSSIFRSSSATYWLRVVIAVLGSCFDTNCHSLDLREKL